MTRDLTNEDIPTAPDSRDYVLYTAATPTDGGEGTG